MTQDPKDAKPDPGTLRGCLLQVAWSMVAPGLILIAGASLIVERRSIGSVQDWFLLGTVALAIAARSLDTTTGTDAAPGEAPPPGRGKYAAWVLALGALLFVVGHFVAPLVL